MIRLAFCKRVVSLFKVQHAVGHVGDDAALGRADDPAVRLAFGPAPNRHLAGGAVGQDPIRPILVSQREAAPHLNGIYAKKIKHVLVHDGQLLGDVVDPDRFLGQAQVIPQPRVGNGGDARRAMARKIHRDAVGFLMIECG